MKIYASILFAAMCFMTNHMHAASMLTAEQKNTLMHQIINKYPNDPKKQFDEAQALGIGEDFKKFTLDQAVMGAAFGQGTTTLGASGIRW